MKRCGPPMTDRRLKRLQTRHEVERAAVEDQDVDRAAIQRQADQDVELELVTFCSVAVSAFYAASGSDTEVDMVVQVLERASDEDACIIFKHGGWLLHQGRMHFGYLRRKGSGLPCSIKDLVQAELARRAES